MWTSLPRFPRTWSTPQNPGHSMSSSRQPGRPPQSPHPWRSWCWWLPTLATSSSRQTRPSTLLSNQVQPPPGALGLGQVLTLIPFPLVGPKFHLPRCPSVQGSPPPLPKILVTIPTSSPNLSPGSESSLLLQFSTGCTP